VMRFLRETGRTIACAESSRRQCRRATDPTPGASASFVGSAVVYTAEVKQRVLGVSRETIDGPGVVSEACAREMAAASVRSTAATSRSRSRVAGPDRTAAPNPHRVDRPRFGRRPARARLPLHRRSRPRDGGPSRRCRSRRYLDGSELPRPIA
jgi:PncC family amidohydrolase